MKKLLLPALFLTIIFDLRCQIKTAPGPTKIPLFGSRVDSQFYFNAQEAVRRWSQEVKTEADQKVLDSLNKVYSKSAAKIIGWKDVYYPTARVWEEIDPSERPEITRVSFYNSKLTRLPPEILACKKLEVLELLNSQLEKLERCLNELPNLKSVTIINNHPKHKLKLEKNTHITRLNIRADNPAKLPRSYKNLKALEDLNLSRTKLKTFPNIYRNRFLKELRLAENELTQLRLRPGKITCLEILDMRANNIHKIPTSLKRFPNLFSLNLGSNGLTTVTNNIRCLQKLEYISFYENKLTAIPEGLYDIASLKDIDLFHNRIERVDDKALNWKNIDALDVEHNNIHYIPSQLGDLKNLKGLYLGNNRLTSLPASIRQLPNLEVIKINNNYFTEFPALMLDFKKLTWLDISNNEMTTLPEAIFDFNNLRIFSLYGNKWNDETLKHLEEWVVRLRKKGTSVHMVQPE